MSASHLTEGTNCEKCGSPQESQSRYCSQCGSKLPKTSCAEGSAGALKSHPTESALWLTDSLTNLRLAFVGPEAESHRKKFRTTTCVIGSILGVIGGIALFMAMADMLKPVRNPLAADMGLPNRNGPTLSAIAVVLGLPIFVVLSFGFVGYHIGDKCFNGARWIAEKFDR